MRRAIRRSERECALRDLSRFVARREALGHFKTVRGEVVDYAIVLILVTTDGRKTIRVYDGAHRFNEMHRYTRAGGKRDGTKFHSGSLSEGKDAAINAIKRGYLEMIEGWRGQ